jgi:predicted transposase/invertase (TIGR01784 family)
MSYSQEKPLRKTGRPMIARLLDPKNDVAFKKIFGTEKNKDILIHFLNDMLTFKEKSPIQKVTFLQPVQDPEVAHKKTSIVDILCQDEKGNKYIVEMQVAKEKGFEKRAQYYASKAYVSQMVQNGKYEDLKEVIFLAITDFIMFPDRKGFKCEHVILDREDHNHHLRDLSFTFFELPKFNKNINELKTIVDKWMYFFKHGTDTTAEELEHIIGQDAIIEKAYKELIRFYWNDDQLTTYERVQKDEWDYIAIMDQKFDEGMEEGRLTEKIELAKAFLAQGVPVETVIKATQLPEEKVRKLLS